MGGSPLAQAGELLTEGKACLQQHLAVVLRDLAVLGTANTDPTKPVCPEAR